MKTIKTFNSQAKYMFAVVGLLVATILPGLMPALVAAATVTERSIQLSNSTAGMENVSYQVNFKPASNAGALVVDFCGNSPLIGQSCTAPAGFDASTVASTDPDVTAVSGTTNKVIVTSTMTGGVGVSIDLTGITNPDASDPLYARILTYTDVSGATAYQSTDTDGADGTTPPIDEGGVAIAITDTIGVAGLVLESMTFCVAGATITADCANADTPGNEPTLKLGETTGSVTALVPGTVSSGKLYTQISTNAANGAVVRLKSDAAGCGGLMRAGDLTACDIAPAGTTDILADGPALFGVKTATATTTGSNPTGTLQPAALSIYNNTTYALNYDATGEDEGVTSPFGDPFLDTAGAPANNQNMELTFGATITNDTPAGQYSADLSMIATGTF